MKAVKEFKRLVWRRVFEGKKTGKGGGELEVAIFRRKGKFSNKTQKELFL
jgi:hypothetical protein